MLQKILKAGLLLMFIFMMKAEAQNGSPSPIMIESSINIVQPITIEKVSGQDLHFGKFSAYASSSGTITLTPAGVRSFTGSINLLTGATVGAAKFIISGHEGALFSFELPTTTYITNQTFGADVMEITQYSTDLTEPYTIGTGGTTTFNVGATLTKDAGDRRGTYTGTFSLTVNYQ